MYNVRSNYINDYIIYKLYILILYCSSFNILAALSRRWKQVKRLRIPIIIIMYYKKIAASSRDRPNVPKTNIFRELYK